MKPPVITVQNLAKTYRVPVRPAALRAAARSLLRPSFDDVPAVAGVSFSVQPGEMVGLIGPNGAGKTTTLKMLAGLLHPSAGTASVAGFVPWQRRPAYLRSISMVMGNKSQMLWDIPPMDSFRVLAEIYGVPPAALRATLDELIELLDMRELLNKPVRTLSLGERMKCELVGGLLYQPAVLFLDEPTLGLDVSMQLRLRRFLAEYNQRSGVTVVLTSHYMGDVMALCPRVILIHQGRLLYDGELGGLAARLAPFKLLRFSLREDANLEEAFSAPVSVGEGSAADGGGAADRTAALGGLDPLAGLELPAGVEVVSREGAGLTLRAPRGEAPALAAHLLQTLAVVDLTIEDPPIEAVIDQVYSEGAL